MRLPTSDRVLAWYALGNKRSFPILSCSFQSLLVSDLLQQLWILRHASACATDDQHPTLDTRHARIPAYTHARKQAGRGKEGLTHRSPTSG